MTKAVDKAKYRAWETVGVEKRDLFKREVGNVKEEQEETSEAFKDALTQLKEIYHVEGGNLEREQRKLNSAYEDAAERAQEVHASIQKVDKVAGARIETEISRLMKDMESSNKEAEEFIKTL